MPLRDHRLRERRLKLGASQFLIGCLAGWEPTGAQPSVSYVERNAAKVNPASVQRVRSALVWLESEPRRLREAARADAAAAAATEVALAGDRAAASDALIVERLVDLLWDGRPEDFDALAARVPEDLVRVAGDAYVDQSAPVLANDQASP